MGRMEALILGIIQGLTEFMPISSNGHMQLIRTLMGNDVLPAESLLFTVMVHFATALATIIVFWSDVVRFFKGLLRPSQKENFTFSISILISMLPALAVGFFLENFIEDIFLHGEVFFLGIMFFATALVLLFANNTEEGEQSIKPRSALVMGLVQAATLIPGLSRSGFTIAAALFQKVDREEAVRFSFLMVVPLILGRALRDILAGGLTFGAEGIPLYIVLGFLGAFFSGLWICRWMVHIVVTSNLNYFAVYLFLIGTFSIIAQFIDW